jgi:hypothetical protein
MAKRTPTKPTPTYPDLATPAFVEWVKANLGKRRGRAVALGALQVELRRRKFREDGEALSIVRALGDPKAVLLAEHGLVRPRDLRTRRGFRAVEVAHVRSALTALVFSDPRVDFADGWRDAKMAFPKRALALCDDLEDAYEGREPRHQSASSTTRRRRQEEDRRQIRAALEAVRDVRAVLSDDYDSVWPRFGPLHDDEQVLLAVAKSALTETASWPKSLRWCHELAQTLVVTLEAEARARKDVIGLAFMALLPITGQLWRVEAALQKTLSASDGARVRLDKNKKRWRDEWYPRFADARKLLKGLNTTGTGPRISDSRIIATALKSFKDDLKAELKHLFDLRKERVAHNHDPDEEENDRLKEIERWLNKPSKPRTIRTHFLAWKGEHRPTRN